MLCTWASQHAAAGMYTALLPERVITLRGLHTPYGQGITPTSQAPTLSGVVRSAREAVRIVGRLQGGHLLCDEHGTAPDAGRPPSSELAGWVILFRRYIPQIASNAARSLATDPYTLTARLCSRQQGP
jgi:hypothetical protein